MDLGLRGDVAVVTGAGHGLGTAIATALADEGCRVALWDVDHDAAIAVADDIVGRGGEAVAMHCDVTDSAAVDTTMAAVADHFGTLHVLVNNAGFSRDAAAEEMTDEAWGSVLAVCLTAPFFCARAAIPIMRAQRYGRIVMISSRAHLGDTHKANYSAAKAGVIGLTSSLALELGASGITVNAVAPGMVLTDRVRGLPRFAELEAAAREGTPAGRMGEPDDIARAVLYLAARSSGFVSGEVLHLTGGRYRA